MSKSKDKILVVDDEPQIGKVIRRALESRGFEVRVAPDGESAFDVFRAWRPDLVISDLAMPNLDGLGLCARIRKNSAVPIIVLSVKGEEKVKVEALDAGADDYVTKPFGMDELLARVRATLRRNQNPAGEASKLVEAGHFRIDVEARLVTLNGNEVHLTPKEFDLMVHLVRRAG